MPIICAYASGHRLTLGRVGDSSSTGTQQSCEQVDKGTVIPVGETVVVTGKSVDTANGDDSSAVIDETVDIEPEPLIDFDFYVTGFTKQVKYSRVGRVLTLEDFLYLIYFDVYKDGHLMFKTTNSDLNDLGYTTKTLTECVYKLSYQASSRIVMSFQWMIHYWLQRPLAYCDFFDFISGFLSER